MSDGLGGEWGNHEVKLYLGRVGNACLPHCTQRETEALVRYHTVSSSAGTSQREGGCSSMTHLKERMGRGQNGEKRRPGRAMPISRP